MRLSLCGVIAAACLLAAACSAGGLSPAERAASRSTHPSELIPELQVSYVARTYQHLGFMVRIPVEWTNEHVRETRGCPDQICTFGARSSETQVTTVVPSWANSAGKYEVDVMAEPPGFRSLSLTVIAVLAFNCTGLGNTTLGDLPAVQCSLAQGESPVVLNLVQHAHRLYVITTPRGDVFSGGFLHSFTFIGSG